MRAGIALIRKELDGIYQAEEIESLIFLIFEALKGYSRTRFLLARDELLTPEELEEVGKIVARLKKNEPIQYILGTSEFFGLSFYTVPGVLIPRPETEELVQWIISENQLQEPTILDIGSGSGCIAVSLKKNITRAMVLACDVSPVCLATSRRNAELNNCSISILEYDILLGTPEFAFPEFDIIVSNPPYIRETERIRMEKNVLEYEPELALFVPDEDPLLFYERIANFACGHLKAGGQLYFEINEAMGEACLNMLINKGFSAVQLKTDIHGKDRMIRSVFLGSTAGQGNALR